MTRSRSITERLGKLDSRDTAYLQLRHFSGLPIAAGSTCSATTPVYQTYSEIKYRGLLLDSKYKIHTSEAKSYSVQFTELKEIPACLWR